MPFISYSPNFMCAFTDSILNLLNMLEKESSSSAEKERERKRATEFNIGEKKCVSGEKKR